MCIPKTLHKLVFLFVIILPSFAYAGEYALTVEVPAGRFECFFQTVTSKHKTLEVYYQVIEGGDLDVNFMLMSGGRVLVQDDRKSDNTHRVENPEPNEYQFCYDNTFSYQAKKVVFFEIYLYDSAGRLEEEDQQAEKLVAAAAGDPQMQELLQQIGMTLSQFHDSFDKVKVHLNKIEYFQSMLRASEARDRLISTAQNDRVMFWSLINTVVLLSVGAIQVYMIRCMFEENSRIGRALRK